MILLSFNYFTTKNVPQDYCHSIKYAKYPHKGCDYFFNHGISLFYDDF